MNKCLFCSIPKEKIIFENKHFFSIFDEFPVSPGHALVIPKTHILSLLDLSTDQWSSLKPAISEVIKIIQNTKLKGLYTKMLRTPINEKMKKFCEDALHSKNLINKPDAYNIGVNDGEVAGRTIHHLHIQIIPRYNGDVENYIGGIRNIIPEKGNYR